MENSFDNSEIAFKYKTDSELKNARLLFSSMKVPVFSTLGIKLTPYLIRAKFPVRKAIRSTIFKQFVGGETLEQTEAVTDKLYQFGVQTILDYGVEGKDTDEVFDRTAEEYVKLIEYASRKEAVPFVAIKVTGLASFDLLQQLNEAPRLRSGVHDSEEQRRDWKKLGERMFIICEAALKCNVGIMIDAEESWIQDPIDRLVMEMMQQYNKEKIIVFNTLQLYRKDRLDFLKISHSIAQKNNFKLGVKLVRGAYMEKERERALLNGYDSPIQNTKEDTDKDYNLAVNYCLQHLEDISFIVASHNEYSNLLAANYLLDNQLPKNHPHVHFSQLYGMSDDITFNLADMGFSASKYLPYGPLNDVVPYLMRRAIENSSVKGQTGRELSLINKEIARRKKG